MYIQGANRSKSDHILQTLEPSTLQCGLSEEMFNKLLEYANQKDDGQPQVKFTRSKRRTIKDVSTHTANWKMTGTFLCVRVSVCVNDFQRLLVLVTIEPRRRGY
jgi:hypothetical protein